MAYDILIPPKVYDLEGAVKSLSNPYLRYIRISDGAIWDTVTASLSTSTSWADSAQSLSLVSGTKKYGWEIPNLPDGLYDVQLYDGASPADTDELISSEQLLMPTRQIKQKLTTMLH